MKVNRVTCIVTFKWRNGTRKKPMYTAVYSLTTMATFTRCAIEKNSYYKIQEKSNEMKIPLQMNK